MKPDPETIPDLIAFGDVVIWGQAAFWMFLLFGICLWDCCK